MTNNAVNLDDVGFGCACEEADAGRDSAAAFRAQNWKPNGFCDECSTRWKPCEMPAYGGGMSNPPLAGIWAHVVEDMKKRDAFGYSKYGKHLEPHDGRDSLKDAYEEALDLAVYLRKAIYERDGK